MGLRVGWLAAVGGPLVGAVLVVGVSSSPAVEVLGGLEDEVYGDASGDGGIERGRRFMNALKLITRAVSLGDAETLIQHPASMTHASYGAEERARHGISDGLIRMSVGLENTEDLIDDLDQALRTL